MGLTRSLRDPSLLVPLLVLAAGLGAGLRGAWDSGEVAGPGPAPVAGTALAAPPAGGLVEAGRQWLWGPGPAWAAGLTLVGTPLSLLAVWVRGYLLGVVVALAAASQPQGLGSVGVVLAAHLVASTGAVLGGREALRFGAAVLRAALGIRPHELPAAFQRFVAAGALLAALALAAGGMHWLAWSLASGLPGPRPA